MIKNSHCKINLALAVTERRPDGFSEIETVMIPVQGVADTLSIEPAQQFAFSSSGIKIDCEEQNNLCVRAWKMIEQQFNLPPVAIHLNKTIPFGAGLGAGSANAAAVIEMANEMFNLKLNTQQLRTIAAKLGSDTPFFIDPKPMLAQGKGDILTPIYIVLDHWWLAMVKIDQGVSTKEAYQLVVPKIPQTTPQKAIQKPIETWKKYCTNDFEIPIFKKIPRLAQIKQQLYDQGATFAAMSGSGSTIFGLFEQKPTLDFDCFTHIEQL